MKMKYYAGSIAIVALAALAGCNEQDDVSLMPEHLNGIERLESTINTPSGVWEGDGSIITEHFKVDIQHSNNTQAVVETEVLVLDDFHTEYTFIIGTKFSPSGSTNEIVEVDYAVKTGGVHHLDFYYKETGKDRRHMGAYEFTLNF